MDQGNQVRDLDGNVSLFFFTFVVVERGIASNIKVTSNYWAKCKTNEIC